MAVLYIRCSEELHAALTRVAAARPPLTVAELARGILATAIQEAGAPSTPEFFEAMGPRCVTCSIRRDLHIGRDDLGHAWNEGSRDDDRSAPYSRVSSVALSLDGEMHVWTDDGTESYDDFVTRAVAGGRRPSSVHRSDCTDDSCTGCHPLNDLTFRP